MHVYKVSTYLIGSLHVNSKWLYQSLIINTCKTCIRALGYKQKARGPRSRDESWNISQSTSFWCIKRNTFTNVFFTPKASFCRKYVFVLYQWRRWLNHFHSWGHCCYIYFTSFRKSHLMDGMLFKTYNDVYRRIIGPWLCYLPRHDQPTLKLGMDT